MFDALSSLLILGAIVLVFTTRQGRGLPGLLSGQHLEDARATLRNPQAFPITDG
ncbi:Uncharacterised protein [Mycobacterium tuberculosis]|nr:Uncharacterised protein [Mycobacterium tuberculosis]